VKQTHTMDRFFDYILSVYLTRWNKLIPWIAFLLYFECIFD